MRAIRALPVAIASLLWLTFAVEGQKPDFKLAPAVAIEAEDFAVESGWKVILNGSGNYMVDIIGFNHISGERVLGIDSKNATASAFADVEVPEDGDYRLWVRYEYSPFSEARFKVLVKQGEKQVLDTVMGARDNPRYAFGETKARPQYDPSWGPEGLVEEVASVGGLKKGKARIELKGVEQPQTAGVTANRNIDLVYLTRDTADTWLRYYHQHGANLYPILDAFRDSRGPRWEVRFTNRGDKPASYRVNHHYNRLPWGADEGNVVANVMPAKSSDWIGLKKQDTTHYGLIQFGSTPEQAFEIEVRPVGGQTVRTGKGDKQYAFYFPAYAKWNEPLLSQLEVIEQVRKHLAGAKQIGRAPRQPLCYGGWIPVGRDDEVGRNYAKLYSEIGMRAVPSAPFGPAFQKNLEAVGVPRTRSEQVMTYRNPPTAENIAAAKKYASTGDNAKFLQWYDYGDEIGFSEWIGMLVADELAKAKAGGQKTSGPEIIAKKWRDWLAKHRPGIKPEEYWLPKWGAFDAAKMKPDSSADAAKTNPRLYVDSVIFYEDTAIAFAAAGMKAVKATLGQDVWCGANYSGHPFYYPTTTMYVKWFRGGAADMGRHSEYFWQVGQLGPMINGYFAEHFRAGMRDNPKAVLRQYNMPHLPGNSDASFLRSAFTHLAHGAKMLDFFGIGMNDSWTENYIDIRQAPKRYQSVRDVTYSLGLVEDVILDSKVVPSPVALLVSSATERWDFAGIATDHAGHAHFGPEFRKSRLLYHIERLGLWKAFTFAGASPDLLIEDDLTPERLKNFKVLVLVGDCVPPEVLPHIEAWVKEGGVLLATSTAARFDPYRKSTAIADTLLGLESRTGTEAETFFRPRQELPFLKAKTSIKGDDWKMPVLAASERVKVAKGTEVLAKFEDDQSPALTVRSLGKGKIYYTATYPGVSYLWTALQPPIVPDRSPTSHLVPTRFDEGARKLLAMPLQAANIDAAVRADLSLLDTRLIATSKGYLLPVANYNAEVGQPVKLALKLDGKIAKVTSAYHGELPAKEETGRWLVTIPALGYGDILRLDR